MVDSRSRYARWRSDLGSGSGRHHQEWSKKRETEERLRYTALKDDLTRAPDGSYPTEMQDDGVTTGSSSSRKQPTAPPLEVNNPLSLSDNNPWHTYFASLSMLDQIKVDVQRAFPEDEQLRDDLAQQQLIRVLFVWSLMKDNENVGYRQGMHEIAAICWLVRKDASSSSQQQQQQPTSTTAEQKWLEADTFILFELIMTKAKGWYEWKSQPKFPISRQCDAIQALLASTDAQLAAHLSSIGIEMQLFAIRWVRLIFTRELPLGMALIVWDNLFSLDPSLNFVNGICVAMLIRIRSQLFDCDYSSAFQALLNYPAYALDCPPNTLVKQAQEIAASPSQMTLMSLMQENEEMLQIPASSRQEAESSPSPFSSYAVPSSVPPSLAHLTKGAYAQTLSSGLGRALYNVQRTVNAAYLSHASSNGASDGFPPLIDSVHRSAPSSRDAAIGELEEIKQRDKDVGSNLVRVIDVLEKHWSEVLMVSDGKEESEQRKAITTQREADFLLCLTSLKHSRDVLLGISPDFDASIMDGPKVEKAEDQKGREFGQRFKRSVEVTSPPSIPPIAPVDRGARQAASASASSSPLQNSTPPSSSITSHPIQSLPPRQHPPKMEPVNDPLGVLTR